MSRVRRLCCTAAFTNSAIQVRPGRSADENVIPGEGDSYRHKNLLRVVSDMKIAHLQQMFTRFIPRERWLPFLL